MHVFISALLAVTLTACANITPRGGQAKATWTSSVTLDGAAACVVGALNRQMAGGAITPAVTHAIQTTRPGRVVEVMPQQQMMLAGEVYFVRLTSLAPGKTRIELFAAATWWRKLAKAVEACA